MLVQEQGDQLCLLLFLIPTKLEAVSCFCFGVDLLFIAFFSRQVVNMDEEEELEEDNLEPVNENNKDSETGKKDIL